MRRLYKALRQLDIKSPEFIALTAIALTIFLSILIRFKLRHFESQDYIGCISPWFDILKHQGFSAFNHRFSDYNFPYLYLLFFSTFIPISKILVIKLIAIFFDFVLAAGVYMVVNHFRKDRIISSLAAIVCLFLPTVFINSSMWGQCDSIFTGFIVWSLFAAIKGRNTWAWVLWGIGFAFKLQAVFFLPVLLLIWLKSRDKWYIPLYAAIAPIASIIPATLAGRPILEAASVYFTQYNSYKLLTLNAPTVFQWIPNSLFTSFNSVGILIAAACILMLAVSILRYKKFAQSDLLICACLFLFLVPFLLPQMHERYFYTAEVFALILAFVMPRLAPLAIAAELIGFFSYSPFLFKMDTPIAFPILSLGELIIITILGYILFSRLAANNSQSDSKYLADKSSKLLRSLFAGSKK
jgi:Gpi18-like mannosyltransferase